MSWEPGEWLQAEENVEQGSQQSAGDALGFGWLPRKCSEQAELTRRRLRERLGLQGRQVRPTGVSVCEAGVRLLSHRPVYHT